MQRVRHRGQQHHAEVRGEEPERDGGVPDHRADLGRLGAEQAGQQGDAGEQDQQGGGGSQQPAAAVAQPVAPSGAPAPVRLQRGGVGVAPDQEEQRHDLEQPRAGAGPDQFLQGVVAAQSSGRVVVDHDDQPVTNDHHRDRHRAEQVDVAFPSGGRAAGELPQAAHGVRLST